MLRIDPKTGEAARVTTTGPDSIVVAPGEVLVANTDGTLTWIDPATLAISVKLNSGYQAVAVGGGGIWTVGPQGLVHLNRERVVVGRIPQATGFAVVTGGGAVWVLDDQLRRLWKVDPRTDRIVKRIRLRFDPGGAAFGLGRVWVTNRGGDALV